MATVKKAVPPVTGKTLADIAKDRQTLDEWLVEHEGELTPELESLLRSNEIELTEKIARLGYIISEEEIGVEAIEAQIKRLQARKQSAERRIDWLKNGYIAQQFLAMKMEPGDAVRSGLATVRLQLNNPRLDGDITVEKVKPAYVRVIPEQREVDRVKLLADAKLDPTVLPEGVKVVRDISVRVA
jgi:hypothetical protein